MNMHHRYLRQNFGVSNNDNAISETDKKETHVNLSMETNSGGKQKQLRGLILYIIPTLIQPYSTGVQTLSTYWQTSDNGR